MTLPETIAATYVDRGPGDTAHQQHHDVIHTLVNALTDGPLPAELLAFLDALYEPLGGGGGGAPLDSPAFTGVPTAPTAAPLTSTTQLATTAFVVAAVAALVDASPAALNTLNELASALNDDPNFATTVLNTISAHEADTTNIHGIADTALLETTAGAQAKANAAQDNAENNAATELATHEADTTSIHGIANTSLLLDSTIVDAKGDLIVGTAADTAARLAVGVTDGHVLTVDSAEAAGMKWAAVVGGGGGSMDDFTVGGDIGTPQVIGDGNTLTISGGSGIVTEAGAVDMVTVGLASSVVTSLGLADSAVQPADLAAYTPKARTISTEAGATYTLAAGDVYLYKRFTDASPEVTVPDDGDVTWPVGGWIEIFSAGGPITFIEDTSVTINVAAGQSLIGEDAGSGFTLIKVAAQTWDLVGRLAAA